MFDVDEDSRPLTPGTPPVFTTYQDMGSPFSSGYPPIPSDFPKMPPDSAENDEKDKDSRPLLQLSPIHLKIPENSKFDFPLSPKPSNTSQLTSTPFMPRNKSESSKGIKGSKSQPPISPSGFDSPSTPPMPDEDYPDSPKTPPYPDDISTPPYPSSKTPPLKSKKTKKGTEDLERPESPVTPPLPDELEDRLTPISGKKESSQIWNGIVHMPDVAKFLASAFEVSGKAAYFTGDVPSTMNVVGRIAPETVWEYIAQTKKTGNKEILVIRFQPSSELEKVPYIALYSYLSNKKRYAVIGNCMKSIKDFYIIPLASHQPIPQVLLPLDGPGFEEHRSHMLIGVIVRSKHRKIYDSKSGDWITIGDPYHPKKSIPEEKMYSPSKVFDDDLISSDDSDEGRSYTPPPPSVDIPEIDLEKIVKPSKVSKDQKTKSSEEFDSPSSIAENSQNEQETIELSDGDKSPDKDGEFEAYSPSRPCSTLLLSMNESLKAVDTSKISLPSNLQEILNKINSKDSPREISEEAMKASSNEMINSIRDMDLRPYLHQDIDPSKDEDLRLLNKPVEIPVESFGESDRDLRMRDPRLSRASGDDDEFVDPEMSEAEFRAKKLAMETSSQHRMMPMPPGDPSYLPPPPPPMSQNFMPMGPQIPPGVNYGPPIGPHDHHMPGPHMQHMQGPHPSENRHVPGYHGPPDRHIPRPHGPEGNIPGPHGPPHMPGPPGSHGPPNRYMQGPSHGGNEQYHGGPHGHPNRRGPMPPGPPDRYRHGGFNRYGEPPHFENQRNYPEDRPQESHGDNYGQTVRYPQPGREESRYPDERWEKRPRTDNWDDHSWDSRRDKRDKDFREFRNYREDHGRSNKRWEGQRPNYRDEKPQWRNRPHYEDDRQNY